MKFNFKAYICLILAAAFITIAPVNATARSGKYKDNLEIGSWRHELAGDIGFKNKGFDLKSDFGANGNFSENTNLLAAYTYNTGYLSDVYLKSSFIKDKGLLKAYGAGGNVLVNNITFGAGGFANINTDLRITDIELLLSREIASNDENGFVEFLYGLKMLRVSMDLNDRDFPVSNQYLRKILLPVAGISANCKIDEKLSFFGTIYGTGINTGKDSSKKNYKTLDMDAGIEYHLTPRKPEYTEIGPGKRQEGFSLTPKTEWFIKLGYKRKIFKETEGSNIIKIDHCGPELSFIARF